MLRHLVFLAILVLAVPAVAQKKPIPEAAAIGGGPPIEWVTPPERIGWAPDGVHLVRRRGSETVWVDPTSGAERAPEPKPEAPDQPRVRTIDRDLYIGAPTEKDVAKLRRLTRDGAAKEIVTPSPDRRWVSFVRSGDLVVVDADAATNWAVTDDANPNLIDGQLDWVYQEEVYGRGDYRGQWWRDDGEALAFLSLDESAVKDFMLVDFIPDGTLDERRTVEPEVLKYPKTGDPNPTARLSVAWPKTRQVVPVDLSAYPADALIVRVGWTPDGRLLFMVQDRIQTWLDLVVADPHTGVPTVLLRETSNSWTNRLPFPEWLPDGTFLWLSERTGYQHLYHCEADGKTRRALTTGEWQVRDLVRVAARDGATLVWFTGTKDGAIDDNLYRVDLTGDKLQRLTTGPGRHAAQLDKDGTWFLDTVSAIDLLPEVRLCKGDGSSCEVLSRATLKATEEFVYSPKRFVEIKARDGYPLDATLIAPPEVDPARQYPIYLATYSGPDAPSVANAFRISTWEQFLAQRGCLILQVNVRSASGRGQQHTAQCYQQLGVTELRDLEDAVDYVVANHGGDPRRVAIDGWSYGGFMAAYALTHSTKFSVGIAGAGVHDWRLYDTIYTERYMRTPQENKAGYDKASVIAAAKNLHGHLVILHGARDDNVHLQNSMRLVHELQNAGMDDFELMVYPRSRHGVGGGHLRRFIWRALREYLLL